MQMSGIYLGLPINAPSGPLFPFQGAGNPIYIMLEKVDLLCQSDRNWT